MALSLLCAGRQRRSPPSDCLALLVCRSQGWVSAVSQRISSSASWRCSCHRWPSFFGRAVASSSSSTLYFGSVGSCQVWTASLILLGIVFVNGLSHVHWCCHGLWTTYEPAAFAYTLPRSRSLSGRKGVIHAWFVILPWKFFERCVLTLICIVGLSPIAVFFKVPVVSLALARSLPDRSVLCRTRIDRCHTLTNRLLCLVWLQSLLLCECDSLDLLHYSRQV